MTHTFIFLLLIFGSSESRPEAASLHKLSAVINVLVELHAVETNSTLNTCKIPDPRAVQQVEAVTWAAQIIDAQARPSEVTIGVRVHDLCSESVTQALREDSEDGGYVSNEDGPLLGFLGIGDSPLLAEAAHALRGSSVPLVVTSPRLATSLTADDHVFTTAPDPATHAQAVVAVLHQMGVTSVALVASSPHAVRSFARGAHSKGIQVAHVLQGEPGARSLGSALHDFLQGEGADCPVIALILDPGEVRHLVASLTTRLPGPRTWVLASTALDRDVLDAWRASLDGSSVFLEPHMPELKQFRKDLLDRLQVGFVVKAVSAYSAALRLVQLARCGGASKKGVDSACWADLQKNLQAAVLQELQRFSLPAASSTGEPPQNSSRKEEAEEEEEEGPLELEGTTVRVAHDGELVFNKFVIYDVTEGRNLTMLGWYSESQGLFLDTMLSGPDISSSTSSSVRAKADSPSLTSDSLTRGESRGEEGPSWPQVPPDVAARRLSPNGVWAMAFVAVAAVGVFASLYMLVYVLLRICDGTLQGNQSLGVLLLLAVSILYACVGLYVVPPGGGGEAAVCALRLFVPNMAVAVCLGVLLVKAMQLRSLVLLGLGGRVSYANQYVTLFFVVAVQLGLDLQWFLNHRQEDAADDCAPLPRTSFLLLHAYLALLAFGAFLYGLSVLQIRRNYNEARWLTITSGLTLPIFLGWGLAQGLAPGSWADPAACLALVGLATVMMAGIFIPKMTTIARHNARLRRKRLKMMGVQQQQPHHHHHHHLLHNNTNSISTIFTTLSDGVMPMPVPVLALKAANGGPPPTSCLGNPPNSCGFTVTSRPMIQANHNQVVRKPSAAAKYIATRPIVLPEPFGRDHRHH